MVHDGLTEALQTPGSLQTFHLGERRRASATVAVLSRLLVNEIHELMKTPTKCSICHARPTFRLS